MTHSLLYDNLVEQAVEQIETGETVNLDLLAQAEDAGFAVSAFLDDAFAAHHDLHYTPHNI